ncbi:MAG: hypothetical protein JJU32_18340 [Phormidium sp. BM_Day4_Bin.17]|nr:hypothetical protein [Phormidium sp. BM_Day4_Bin.17]UCJ13618.1 MAG: hypothetical protein JWS08_07655 [Phormidium sp. PBR-2020]
MTHSHEYNYFGDRISWLDKRRMESSLAIRRQLYDAFIRMVGGVSGKIILDHGTTPDTEHIDSNCFIRWLLEDGATVYATSPEAISHLEKHISGLIVVSFPPKPEHLPAIDFVISSAVIEHVGSQANQLQYLREVINLGAGLFLTTPNRYHWLDFHTKIPLLHWLPRPQHRRILQRLGLTFWAQENNLRLLSKKDLARLVWNVVLEQDTEYSVQWIYPKFLGAVSNLGVVAYRKK